MVSGRSEIETPDADPFDLVAIGETMVAFVSRGDPRHPVAVAAGAESNVAAGVARLGCRSRWVSRVGADPLGRYIEESVSACGVDVAVARDPERPTGVMTIHVDGDDRHSAYYRSRSAARHLSPDDLRRAGSARWFHVTGITPALSGTCLDLVEAVVRDRVVDGRVSFDVNYRPVLWSDRASAAGVLGRLARSADLVFIGDDEAEALFGTAETRAVAELVLERDDQQLVLKRGAGSATMITADTVTTEPAFVTEVVEPTGAGDAFAAGYLAATLFGWPAGARLMLGHLMGSRTLGVLDHVSPPFAPSDLSDLTPEGLAALRDRSGDRGAV